MSERKFAYGLNVCEGVECPAETVGEIDESNTLICPTETYDSLAREQRTRNSGIIYEKTAKDLWFEAILKELEEYHTGVSEYQMYSRLKRAQNGVEVAKKLGWL